MNGAYTQKIKEASQLCLKIKEQTKQLCSLNSKQNQLNKQINQSNALLAQKDKRIK
jgi:hypothetical protein